jgi:hypothetical protein
VAAERYPELLSQHLGSNWEKSLKSSAGGVVTEKRFEPRILGNAALSCDQQFPFLWAPNWKNRHGGHKDRYHSKPR